MYKLLRGILKELKSIRKELHIIASNTEPRKVTNVIHGKIVKNENDLDALVDRISHRCKEKLNQFQNTERI